MLFQVLEHQDLASSTHPLLFSTYIKKKRKKGRDGLREMFWLTWRLQCPAQGVWLMPGTHRGRAAGAGQGTVLLGTCEAALQPKNKKVSKAATPLVWAKRTKQGAEDRPHLGQRGCTGWTEQGYRSECKPCCQEIFFL